MADSAWNYSENRPSDWTIGAWSGSISIEKRKSIRPGSLANQPVSLQAFPAFVEYLRKHLRKGADDERTD